MPDDKIEVQVLLFARFAELLGTERLQVRLEPPATVARLLDRLAALPGGHGLPATPLVARNHRQVTRDEVLASGDEVALLPPLAGG